MEQPLRFQTVKLRHADIDNRDGDYMIFDVF
jgi:hypothetical protein